MGSVKSPQLDPETLLSVENLHTYFQTDEGVIKAVNGVSFDIKRQKVLGVVGESGCGKSITAMSIMQLLPKPHGKIHSGRIFPDRMNGGHRSCSAGSYRTINAGNSGK